MTCTRASLRQRLLKQLQGKHVQPYTRNTGVRFLASRIQVNLCLQKPTHEKEFSPSPSSVLKLTVIQPNSTIQEVALLGSKTFFLTVCAYKQLSTLHIYK